MSNYLNKKQNDSYIQRYYILAVLLSLTCLKLSTILSYLVFMVIICCFIFANKTTSILIYIVLLPWETLLNVASICSLLTILQIILLIKAIVWRIKFHLNIFEIFALIYFLIIGVISFLNYNSISGIAMALEMFIIFFILNITDKNQLLPMLKCSVISFLASLLFALVHSNFAQRWVDGIGYVPLFRGVLESNETAFYCGLILMFIGFVPYSLIKKLLLYIVIFICLVSTVSITGIAIAAVAVVYLLVFNLFFVNQNGIDTTISPKVKMRLIFMLVCIIGVTLIVFQGEAIITRIQNVISNIKNNDFNSATSDRTELFEIYLMYFNRLPLIQRIFGVGITGREYLLQSVGSIGYPHNSFVELAFYEGIVGLMIRTITIIYRISTVYKKDKTIFKFNLGIKLLTVIEGLSVTMCGYGYWTFWLLI